MELLNKAQVNGPDKKIVFGPNGEKKYPDGTIFTKLKFKKSDKSGLLVGFISQNPRTGRIKGVREDSPYWKQVCIVDKTIAPDIIPGALYSSALVPMDNKKGYIVIEATMYQFQAHIEISYVPKAVYVVSVKFGNKTLFFDPKDGPTRATRSLKIMRDVIAKRMDILNLDQTLKDFTMAAEAILNHYEQDGFYVKRQTADV